MGNKLTRFFYKPPQEWRDEDFLQKRPTKVAQRVPRVPKIRNVRSSRDKQPGSGLKGTRQLESGQKFLKQSQNKKVVRPKNLRNSKYIETYKEKSSGQESQSRELQSQEHFEPYPQSRLHESQSSQSRDYDLIKSIWGNRLYKVSSL